MGENLLACRERSRMASQKRPPRSDQPPCPIYGLLRFASIFRFDVSGSEAPLRPYIRPLARSLLISGPDGFPRVFIPITLAVLMTYGQSGLAKTPVRPCCHRDEKAQQRGGKNSLKILRRRAPWVPGSLRHGSAWPRWSVPSCWPRRLPRCWRCGAAPGH